MQWVETTGRTVEDAKEAALDQLGIDESEAEFEVLEEPRTGLFGRVRNDARVRARVVPRAPRPKQERRSRRGRKPKGGSGGGESTGGKDADKDTTTTDTGTDAEDTTGAADGSSGGRSRSRRRRGGRSGANTGGDAASGEENKDMTEDAVNVDQQADIISEFLDGLLEALDIEGEVERTKVDDDTVELAVSGADDLGLLIGPKGQTLTAVHELSRTVLQRRATGRHDGRVRIDIGGYRQRRAEALARFVVSQAEVVASEGVSRALEPMNAVDRKVVHDAVNEIEGVSTISEGVDPNRRVVIVPDADAETDAG